MNKTVKIAIVVVLLVALAVGGKLLFSKDSAAPPRDQTSETDDSKHPDAIDIVYTGFGFSPEDWAVSPGATVTMINESPKDLELASDPYPTSIDNPEFNVGRIASGESKSFQVTKEGRWGYHNHLEPTQKAHLAVLRGE